jgi:hypothetical protein
MSKSSLQLEFPETVGTATSSYHWHCIDSIALEFIFKFQSISGDIINMSIVSRLLVGLIAFVFINPVSAHSFNLVFIAPLTSISGQSALKGFLLATREQDSHENEESDGHLGGLDSYIYKVDIMKGEMTMPKELESTIRKSEPLFAVGSRLNASILNMLGKNGVVTIDPMSSKFLASTTADPDQLKLMNGENFASEFRRSYGREPDLQAVHGYLSARIIATVVRTSDEQALNDPDELKQTLSEVLVKSYW